MHNNIFNFNQSHLMYTTFVIFFSCMYLMRLIEFLKGKKFLTFSVFANLIGLQYNKYILDDREKNSMSFCVS